MANPAVVVDFVANTRDLTKGFDDASRKAGGFGSKIKGLGMAGAAAGFAALTATIKTGVDEFGEAQKVAAQTDATLKSTGNAAKVTAGHMSDLAGALMKKSGVDDEAIQSGENLLLTFTNIRNEAGKGNDIFDQTTKAALDMSVALGTDMKSASMQLGKALNDPLKGMAKLQRSGVSFTEAQKAQVEALTKSGKTLEAQKIILAEVTKEFGGSAEAAGKTLPGQLNILKQSFSNVAGELVGRLVPVLTAFAAFLVEHKSTVIALAAVIGTLATAIIAVSVATAAWNAVQAIITAATSAWTAAQWLLNAALAANPIGLVVVSALALAGAFVLLWKNSETFRQVVTAALDAVKSAAAATFGWIKNHWPLLVGILAGPFGLAIVGIVKHWDAIKSAVSDALRAVKSAISGAWASIKQNTADAWSAVVNTIKSVWNGLVSWLGGLVERIGSIVGGIVGTVKGVVNTFVDAWNRLRIPGFQVHIKVPKAPDINFGWGGMDLPDIPRLAKGAVVSSPTLAMVGEGQGREIVAPESLLREIAGEQRGSIEVRVFIGDQELQSMIRTEIVDANTGLARALLAGSK